MLTVKLSEAAAGIITDKERFVNVTDAACPRASSGRHTLHSPFWNFAHITLNIPDMRVLTMLCLLSFLHHPIHVSRPEGENPTLALAWQTADSQKTVPPSGTHQGGRKPQAPMEPMASPPPPPTGPASPVRRTWPWDPTRPRRMGSMGS